MNHQRGNQRLWMYAIIIATLTLAGVPALGGGDNCFDTAPVLVSVPGATTINGNNTGVTGPDVCGGFNLGTIWWESFSVDQCADVVIDFCGTSPVLLPSWAFVAGLCAADGSACGNLFVADFADRDTCGDNNIWMHFPGLPAGTYYYPIVSDVQGDYEFNITASPSLACNGACCNALTETCLEDVAAEDCNGPNDSFVLDGRCCELECRAPAGPEYGASGVELLSRVPVENFADNQAFANDIWGYVSPGGREYAIIGLECAAGFVDITTPTAPVIVGQITGPCELHRDMKTFGEYAYVVIEGFGVGLQVIDLSLIDSGVVTLVGTFNPNGFNFAHNIALNEQSGFAFVVDADINPGITAFDLSDPINPTFAGEWTNEGVHDVQVVSYDSGPFAGREIAFASLPGITDGFKIIDVTDKGNMFELSSVTYPNVFIGHQGWLSADRRYFYLGDEGDETDFGVPTTTYVFDVQDIENAFLETTYVSDLCAIDHNMITQGDFLFQANYTSGLRILDVSDVGNIHEVGFFDTRPEDNVVGFLGAWGVYAGLPSGNVIVSDIERGLFVLDVSQAIKPTISPPAPDPSGLNKLRFVSIVIPGAAVGGAQPTAIEIELVSMPRFVCSQDAQKRCNRDSDCGMSNTCVESSTPFSHEGEVRYAQLVGTIEDSEVLGTTMVAAVLSCEPDYQDWEAATAEHGGLMHITGAEIVPRGMFNVRRLAASCMGNEAACVDKSDPLAVSAGDWGDLNGDGSANVSDVANSIDILKGVPTGHLPKYFGRTQPNAPDPTFKVSIIDCSTGTVDPIKGIAYPFPGPCACPSSTSCDPTTACTITPQCPAPRRCLNGFCSQVDNCGRCVP